MLRVKPVSLGEVVKKAREERHYSQAEVGQILSVSTRTVQNWEAGAKPQPRHRRAILAWVNEEKAAA
jgi:DNA-binding transcriptional regulator YiaG